MNKSIKSRLILRSSIINSRADSISKSVAKSTVTLVQNVISARARKNLWKYKTVIMRV